MSEANFRPLTESERRAFRDLTAPLQDELVDPVQPPADAWKPEARPNPLEGHADFETGIPLGHIALNGDFDQRPPQAQ